SVVGMITSVTLAALDPPALAARWAEVLGLAATRSASGGLEIALDPGVVRVVAVDGGAEGVAAVGLAARDPERALATARSRGLTVEGRGVRIGGVRFDLA